MANEFVLKRGLQNIYIAEVTTDTAEAYATADTKHLIPAGEMSISVDSEQAQYWFDNTVFETIGREGASEITISGAGLRAAARAYLNGKEIDEATGAVIDSGQLNTKYFALGAEAWNSDGTKEYFWFAKGSFTVPDENNKTLDESTDANGTELTYSAIPTTHVFAQTGKTCKRVVIDTATTALVDGQEWQAQVVTPENLATVCEKVTA